MYSKFADMIGRPITYTVCLVIFVVSFIAMACSHNYNGLLNKGGQVVYAFGYSGIYVLGPILIGGKLNLVLAFYNFPLIINLFAGSAAAQKMLETIGWRWAFGHISIIAFVASIPIVVTLWVIQRKVYKSGLITQDEQTSEPNETKGFAYFVRRTAWWVYEIDLLGTLLLIAGLLLLLLPLVLARTWGGWGTVSVIACFATSGAAWIIFAIWELKFTSKPVIPMKRWESFNPLYGTIIMCLVWTINGMMDLQYFLTYLKVTRRVKSNIAVYLERGFNATNVVMAVPIGFAVRSTRKWRPFVWAGACFVVLGTGLMVPARNSHSPDAFIVMSQILLGAGCALMNYPTLVGIQGSVPHRDIAVVIAMFELGIAVAQSIGSAIAGAIWNSVLPGLFHQYVPGQYEYKKITSSIPYALALPQDQYEGVVKAYDAAMHILSIVAVCIGALVFLIALQLKGYSLDRNQHEIGEADMVDETGKIFLV
ncbi:major facilitator superfamily domain-containing protein [Choanephora cucurbitarum]|nr:major facilitator superfamily domain-containing protein [Choanephora cucurbitarum]